MLLRKKVSEEKSKRRIEFLKGLHFHERMSEDQPNVHKSNVIHLPLRSSESEPFDGEGAKGQALAKIIPFPFCEGRNDLMDGISQYLELFERGFDFFYFLAERRQDLYRAFPNHKDRIIQKDIQKAPESIYFAALIGFEKIVGKMYEDLHRERQALPYPIPAFDALGDARVLEAYNQRFEKFREKTLEHRSIDKLVNPELRVFGEAVYESSRLAQTLTCSIEQITQLLFPSKPIESHASELQDCLSRVRNDKEAIPEEVRTACQSTKSWIKYVSYWFNELHEQRENFFKAWQEVIWKHVLRVYTSGVQELSLKASMHYQTESEKQGRVFLGIDYYEQILNRLNPDSKGK